MPQWNQVSVTAGKAYDLPNALVAAMNANDALKRSSKVEISMCDMHGGDARAVAWYWDDEGLPPATWTFIMKQTSTDYNQLLSDVQAVLATLGDNPRITVAWSNAKDNPSVMAVFYPSNTAT